MLTVKHLSAGYGEAEILHDVTFSLQPGFHVLLGQNGSGKTTLFRALSGAISPKNGQILLDNESLIGLPPRQMARRLALVLGIHQTLSGITGQDIAEMALYAFGGLFYRPQKSDKERIAMLAREMNIEAILDYPLEKMSTGQRQLVELLAAICQNTPVLLLDEPTSALDYNRTHEFMAQAKRLSKQKIFLSTLHDPALALRYADRILLLKDGVVSADFSPKDTDSEEIGQFLRLLYPQIRVIRTDNQLTVL